ncbi:ABC transporter substrate-binding protein [Ktedonobacter racemifer]|uniref:Extracellular solute-binding protein family 1 n=1 Tax=Ktedonobacter racemifer DSM 44963 TaxID=485913 RepID=D6U0M8_KTERA|nr:ABC transporter substrate-binding protein [Ktedonobacter racemifer]EFH82368.1 extracellular solute-binding protein family 1 [Ktedonobacter racemifer DSM 44963]
MVVQRYMLKAGASLLLLLLFSVAISACGFGQSDSHEVVFWTSVNDDIDISAENQIVAAFEKENPDLHVRIVSKPSPSTGDATALITSVRGGTPPDVYLVDRFTVSQYAAIGLLTDIQPFVKQDGGTLGNNYLPFAWKEASYRGDSYGLPMDTDARGMYYNKDLLRQAGIDPGLFDPSHGPMTVDEVMSIARKMDKTDAKGNYTELGLIPWSGQGFHATWGLDFSAKFFNDKTCQVTPTEPGFETAFRYFQQWSRELDYNKVDTFLATYQPPNAPPSQTPLFTGHLGMSVDGNWTLSSIQQYAPKLNYGITYLPVLHKGDAPFTWSGGFSLVMPQGAHNTGAGWKFMKFMTGPEGQAIYTKVTSHLPTWQTLLQDDKLIQGNQRFFAGMMKFSESRPPLPIGAQYSDAMDAAQSSILLGTSTVDQALQQVYQRLQPQMDQYCPFKLD